MLKDSRCTTSESPPHPCLQVLATQGILNAISAGILVYNGAHKTQHS